MVSSWLILLKLGATHIFQTVRTSLCSKNLTPTKRECYVVPRFGAAIGSGGVGWDLPAIKVIQEKRKGVWVNL